jgi:Xaa-Pro aminopeptidase
MVAGKRYFTIDGPLNLKRDSQSHLNTTWGRGEA